MKQKKTKYTEEITEPKVQTTEEVDKTWEVNKEHRKNGLSINETKLGVTMVLTKQDCETLGINGNTTTKIAIQEIREKLGLPSKPQRE